MRCPQDEPFPPPTPEKENNIRRATEEEGSQPRLWQAISAPAPSVASVATRATTNTLEDGLARSPCGSSPPPIIADITQFELHPHESLVSLASSHSIVTASNHSASAVAAAKAAFREDEHPSKTSTVGPLLALLERSTRQLYRRKPDLFVELVVPFVFVAISVVLWALWGSSHASEVFYENYRIASEYGTKAVPYGFTDETAMCFRSLDGRYREPIGTFHMCREGFNDMHFKCDADMTHIPLHDLVLCITDRLSWAAVTVYDIRRYLGYVSMIATLDVVIKMQWIALAAGEPIHKMAAFSLSGIRRNTRYSSVLSSGNVYFVGPALHTERLISHFAATSSLFTYVSDRIAYRSVEDAFAAAEGKRLWAVVELRQMDENGLDLVLHMNNSALPSFSTTYTPSYAGGAEYDSVELYVVSGFLTLQKTISDYYLTVLTGVNVSQPFYIGSVPSAAFTRVPLLVNARQAVPLIFALAFLYTVSQQVKRTVLEKELRIREAMLIMGLKQWTLYVSDFVVQLVLFVIVSVAAAIMLQLSFCTRSDPLVLLLIFLLFTLTTIPLSGIIAAFFSKARLASLVAPVIYFILVIPMFAMANAKGSIVTGFSIFSPTAFCAALRIFLTHEVSTGFGGGDLCSHHDDPTMAVILGMLTADFFLYYLLMLYLDAVVPKEWGTPKHPLFFVLGPINWCFQRKHKRLEGGPDGRAENGVFETTDYADDVVSFDGLRKEYTRGGERFLAVNNLYWGMQEGEISVLLGHNGAGKTTVLNMMTGMTEPDEGDCYIYGHSVRTEKSAVRQLLGFCPQHNILWSELTCRDHLEFYGKIKGLKGWELEDAICGMLFETDLLDKMDQPAGRLSGGMKRKLSIAIAFVGGSRLVFLDEPTAGLDVGARRQVWELLKRMAQSRTLLLTTHYMDEADLLGSRIGIMSQGRLKCTGSSLFLKSRLGVGYNIVISIDPEIDAASVDDAVLDAVAGATVLGHNGTELTYLLPSCSVDQFPPFLNEIDAAKEQGIRGYALSATTLEEVFLKVSEEDLPHRSLVVSQEQMARIWTCKLAGSVCWSQFKAMLTKRLWCALRDRRMQCFQIVCPVLCLLVAMLLTLIKYGVPQELVLDYSMFSEPTTPVLLTAGCDKLWGPTGSPAGVMRNETRFQTAGMVSDFGVDTWYVHAEPRFGGLACNEPTLAPPGVLTEVNNVHLLNTTSHHQAGIALATYYDQLIKQASGSDHFIKHTAALLDEPDPSSATTFIFVGTLIMIPMCFLPSNAVAWVVKERECGSWQLQKLSGLNYLVYWAANYLFDMAAYLISMCLCISIFAIFRRQEFIGPDRVGATFTIFFLYGLTSTVAAYAISFAFKEHSNAQMMVMAVGLVLGFLLNVIVFVLQLRSDAGDVMNIIRYVFRVIPSYCIGEGIINQLMLKSSVALGNARGPWDMDQLGWAMVYLAAEVPVLWIITLLLDHPTLQQFFERRRYHRDSKPIIAPNEDPDVTEERKGVYSAERGKEDTSDVVRVIDLQKNYGKDKLAVKGSTFSIFPGEVFGLLGTNGAGKTTTISMLCQQFLPTGGSAYVCGYDILENSAEALQCIGYCPQFDGTLDLLTVEEQLQMYASIRGVSANERNALVDALCTLCELTTYRKTVTGELSGGNRRKLSVAMSLVGGPLVLFLDEPSAGMDPVARRGMWTAIQRAAKHCSVVLTTHHLEEVEALADIVAIMVRGYIRCIGDKVHLKNKFGSAFEVSVRLSSARHADGFVAFMKGEFPDAKMNEGDGRRFVYQLPRDRGFGDIFEVFQTSKKDLHITDYSVSQTSIEQVFLRVTEASKHL